MNAREQAENAKLKHGNINLPINGTPGDYYFSPQGLRSFVKTLCQEQREICESAAANTPLSIMKAGVMGLDELFNNITESRMPETGLEIKETQ